MHTAQVGAAPHIIKAMRSVDRTQKWTADKSGIAHTTFHRKIHGGGDFTTQELIRIAAALGIHPADLLPEPFQRGQQAAA